ncbi:MAG: flagellar hook-length control protein FliK [Marinosulfonomonas sp.]
MDLSVAAPVPDSAAQIASASLVDGLPRGDARVGFDQIVEDQVKSADHETVRETETEEDAETIENSWGVLPLVNLQGAQVGGEIPVWEKGGGHDVSRAPIQMLDAPLTDIEPKAASDSDMLAGKPAFDSFGKVSGESVELAKLPVGRSEQDVTAAGRTTVGEKAVGDPPMRAINSGLLLGSAKGLGLMPPVGQIELPTGDPDRMSEPILSSEMRPMIPGHADGGKQSQDQNAVFLSASQMVSDLHVAQDAAVMDGRHNGLEARDVQMQVTSTDARADATPRLNSTPYSQPTNSTQVISFISNAAQTLKDQPIELVLSPEELGRVRLRLNASDSAMGVIVAVERPETLDLLRRNIDLLADQLSDIGYETLSFEFVEDDRQSDAFLRDSEHQGPETGEEDRPIEIAQVQRIAVLPADGVDLRF